MIWNQMSFEAPNDLVDILSACLADLGIEGIEIRDKIPLSEEDRKKLFIDILPELPPDDGMSEIVFYAEPDVDPEKLADALREYLMSIEAETGFLDAGIKVEISDDADWQDNWKAFFKPFRIDETIVIKPTWEEVPDPHDGDIVIEIDPKTAFGSGSHETTKLCVLALKKHLREGMSVLDLGTGSGILAIAAKKLGAGELAATDIDENATAIADENFAINGVDGVALFAGDVITDSDLRKKVGLKKYDIVVANILADVIIPMSEFVGEFMKPGAKFVSSGIIDMKEEQVREALLRNGFIIEEVNKMGDWVSFTAVRG